MGFRETIEVTWKKQQKQWQSLALAVVHTLQLDVHKEHNVQRSINNAIWNSWRIVGHFKN